MEMQPRLLFALRCVADRWLVLLPGALACKGGGRRYGRSVAVLLSEGLGEVGIDYRLSSEAGKIWAFGPGGGR